MIFEFRITFPVRIGQPPGKENIVQLSPVIFHTDHFLIGKGF